MDDTNKKHGYDLFIKWPANMVGWKQQTAWCAGDHLLALNMAFEWLDELCKLNSPVERELYGKMGRAHLMNPFSLILPAGLLWRNE